jgi:cytochrome c553
MKLPVSLLCAAIAALSFGVHAQTAKPDLARGAALFGQVCVACHAVDGNSTTPANPKLAQQHPEYLIKQLQEYKSGKRQNAIMAGFAASLSDEDMRNISYWLASQKATPVLPRTKTWSDSVNASTAAAFPIARSPPVPAATVPMAQAFRPSIPVWPASTPNTRLTRCASSATVCARTVSR